MNLTLRLTVPGSIAYAVFKPREQKAPAVPEHHSACWFAGDGLSLSACLHLRELYC